MSARLLRVARQRVVVAVLLAAGIVAACAGAYAATAVAADSGGNDPLSRLMTAGLYVAVIGAAVRVERRLSRLEAAVDTLQKFYDELR